ncbi:MAG: hypothetical protein LBG52_00415 [Candidatus Peribacteria bacterium]|jgi:FMN phosphatase YigB (HAD superfamily)|nr:hypothetical protein [Candidatus Peribacteria bacterium]
MKPSVLPYPLFTLNHQPEKTDPQYYKTMLRHFNLTTNDVVYFENDILSVESTKSVGITTYHYDPEMKDLESLKQFLDDQI